MKIIKSEHNIIWAKHNRVFAENNLVTEDETNYRWYVIIILEFAYSSISTVQARIQREDFSEIPEQKAGVAF
jgi:hypothetical protein